jgi:hypothetical protein
MVVFALTVSGGLSLQQAGKGIMSCRLPEGKALGGFCAGENLLSSNEKVNVTSSHLGGFILPSTSSLIGRGLFLP